MGWFDSLKNKMFCTHDWEVVDSAFGEPGWTKFKCKKCGETKVKSNEKGWSV